MSPCVSRSRTSSVTDRRLILSCQKDQKGLDVFCRTVVSILLWRRWQQKWLDLSKGQVRRQTIIFTVLQVPQTFSRLVCDHQTMLFYTTIMRRYKVRPFFTSNLSQLSSVTSSISDDPYSQQNRLLQCKQSHEANASKCVRPFIGASDLRTIYLYNNNALRQP